MEAIIQILIYVHAALGTIGLVAGLIALVLQKGTPVHKKLGKVFFVSMLASCSMALVICKLPGHENLFLFLIGLFTIYMILSGKRALSFKPGIKKKPSVIDYLITVSMFIISLIMIVLGIKGYLQNASNPVLYLFFGTLGLFLTLRDFKLFRNYMNQKNAWLVSHIGKMTGAFIASVTAFLVAGVKMGGLIYWILPSVLGFVYIYYYSKKVKSKASLTGHGQVKTSQSLSL